MPKPNTNGCKNGKRTNFFVQSTRSAVQKSQVTVDAKLSANNKVCITSEWHNLPLSSKVCKSQTKSPEYLGKKMFPYMAKCKKGKN